MGTPIGNLGGIALEAEATWGTTVGVAWVWQHPMPSSFGFRREVIEPNLLSYSAHTARGYSGFYADGDINMGLDLNDDVCGTALGLVGAKTVNTYKIGGGDVADIESASILMNYGGGGATPINAHEWIYSGFKPSSLRLDIVPDSNSILTLVGTGKDVTKTGAGDSEIPAPPLETDVFMPADVGAVTLQTETICLFSATIEALVPKSGYERKCLGGAMKEQITNARPDVTFTLNLTLDDQTSNNTIIALNKFVTGTDLGTLLLGTDIKLNNCFMTGDFPPLQDGEIDFTITGTADYLEVTTVP